jgi:RNA polymerase sigma-70 factor (sigma-E family)
MANRTRDGFEQFVASSTDGLLRTAYLIVSDLAEAEDVVQESLFQVARRWPRVSRMDHPVAYARRLVVNLAIDRSKRHARELAELNGHAPEDRADEASANAFRALDARSELLWALAKLPPRQRAVLVLRYFADLPEAEVAELLDCSLGTVKSTASRGLARLESSLRPAPDQGVHVK